ncbi:hypothetical protein [Microbacterium sp. SORGH_AS_0888]|uniref:hypothetical protein n=1 Tax=Microbacterium sp. SORGH_AS_0888 TaxID=3041791 RepID=UPI002788C615|nr:hypothetical protein [Microbacterium sp. SORGH_AS_0888]MDQ1128988.1 hypothetical protein [Microbacterium sp. SORGH_AS_0888]
MSSPLTDDRLRRRRRLIITLTATGLVVLTFAGVGIYGFVARPDQTPPPVATSSTPVTPTVSPSAQPTVGALPGLPATDDPQEYAGAVAHALFDWDTFTLHTPADHRAVLIDDADPSGTETPGLVTDLDGYVPSVETWRDLSEYRTRQSLMIDRIFVPEQWDEAVAAANGQITDGTIAYTIEGTRHREGVWYDAPVASDHPVVFTVFVACEPVFDRCHLLRLSQLDNPLR